MARKSNVGIRVTAEDKTGAALRSVQSNLKLLTAINVAQFFSDMASAVSGSINKMKEFAGEADRVAKAAKRVGISAESMSQLGFAAEQSGNSVAEMQTAITALTRRAAAMPKVFAKWGISVKDANGQFKSTDQLLDDVADRVQSLGSASERSALAQDLMSEAGRKLVPMLMGGSSGIQALRDEADRLGITITNLEAKLSEEFNDSLNRLNKSVTGVGRSIGSLFLPYITAIADELTEVSKRVSDWVKANKDVIATGIDKFLVGLAENGLPAVLVGVNMIQTAFNGLQLIIGAVKTAIQAQLVVFLSVVDEMVSAAIKAVSIFNKDAAAALEGNAFVQGLRDMRRSSKEVLDGFIADMSLDVEDIKRNSDVLESLAVKFGHGIQGIRSRVQAQRGAIVSTVSPTEDGSNSADETTKAIRAVKEFGKVTRNTTKAQEKNRGAIQDIASSMQGPLASGITGVITGTASLGEAMQRLATQIINEIITSLASSFIKALFFAEGGMVPGTGSTDSVPAFLTPGEYVLPKHVVDSIRSGQKPSSPGMFNDGGLVAAGSGAHTSVNLSIMSVAPPNSATIRRDIAEGLAPVLQGITENKSFRNTVRRFGRKT